MNELLVGNLFQAVTARAPNRVAATIGDAQLTFGELGERARPMARALADLGIGHLSRVVWWGDTTLDVIPLSFAIAELGAAFVPINTKFSEAEAGPVLDVADPTLVITDGQHAGGAELAALAAGTVSTGIPTPPLRETDPHVIFFTSGSTGTPKGVVLSHRATRLRTMVDASPVPIGPAVCMFPQFHMAGWQGPTQAWTSAEEVVYVRAEAEPLLSAIDRRRATRLYAIPAVWRRILEADRSGFDTSSLRFADTGTSATTPELLHGIADAFPGTRTSIYYGSTEAGGVCRLWPEDIFRKVGSVGPPATGVEVRLTQEGELVVRSPLLMSGYFRNEEATAAAVVDGWFHTGDLAERDDEGHYAIVGRAGDIIRTGGESVAPAEVDSVILTHPAVADGAVAGVPDEDWGEIVTAFVVLRDGGRLDLPALRAHCQGRLAPYKHPRRLIVVDEIPRTGATGQAQRRRLVELARRQ